MSLEKRARRAAERYLKIKGYTILEPDFDGTGFIIAEDDDDVIVFIDVNYSTKMKDIIPNLSRDAFERMIFKYCKQLDAPLDKSIRYDTIEVFTLGEDRAIIRHRVNAELEE